MLNNCKLNEKDTLRIWILVQIKHLLKSLKEELLKELILEIYWRCKEMFKEMFSVVLNADVLTHS